MSLQVRSSMYVASIFSILCVSLEKYASSINQTVYFISGHLRRHKLIHLNEKAFICDICGKRFNLFINLNAHIRRHIGIRPFVCEICKASFMDRTRLKLHLRSHTGEKPFPCTVCEKKFADRYYLKVHMRLHVSSIFSLKSQKPVFLDTFITFFLTNYFRRVKSHFNVTTVTNHFRNRAAYPYIRGRTAS